MDHDNKPLTLEQLRQMDGQPVWIESKEDPEINGWRLIYWDRGKYLVLISKSLSHGFLSEEYGRTWLAYAQKPVNFDAWEPCPNCEKPSCVSCAYHIVSTNAEPCRRCSPLDGSRYEPLPFCPMCGRPLTQSARDMLEKRIREG